MFRSTRFFSTISRRTIKKPRSESPGIRGGPASAGTGQMRADRAVKRCAIRACTVYNWERLGVPSQLTIFG